MWTKEQSEEYQRIQAIGKLRSNEIGLANAKQLKSEIRPTKETRHDAPGINSIFLALALEPSIAITDFNYESLGFVFKETIDLYVGRKCARVIPPLVEAAKRLNDQKHTSRKTAFEGGGSDHWYWVDLHTKTHISMRWDTQSYSYYITLNYDTFEKWKIYVAMTELGKKRKPAKNNWEKEPGYVIEYETYGMRILKEPEYQIDDKQSKNAWANLGEINRWLILVNPVCTSLNIDLYEPPFDVGRNVKE